MVIPYIKYLLRSGNEHAIHSPFVYDLYTKVIRPKDRHSDYDQLQALRKQMLSSTEEIEVLDLGAGSRVNRSNKRKVRQIAKNAEKPERFGRLFHRLVRHYRPANVLELGTSLGLTTLYFAKANPAGKVTTLEGCPETVRLARTNFEKAGESGIEVVTGNIDETLGQTLQRQNQTLDMVYFDANHRYEPTVRYFEACLPFAGNDSLFIFDDIYWSDEMTQAWEYIKAHPQVTVTVDLFWIGLVYFRKEQVKENFVLRF
ncbi:O-methyltransferase [Telluribacter humicola]|uniref:O-methyltransferase n=1 Tax=Telluribacter humicola TaxID=1720261 RepID=UPI001A97575D|nr:class I SAM-dependent methyltransferase [Telluribacter humicola]